MRVEHSILAFRALITFRTRNMRIYQMYKENSGDIR